MSRSWGGEPSEPPWTLFEQRPDKSNICLTKPVPNFHFWGVGTEMVQTWYRENLKVNTLLLLLARLGASLYHLLRNGDVILNDFLKTFIKTALFFYRLELTFNQARSLPGILHSYSPSEKRPSGTIQLLFKLNK